MFTKYHGVGLILLISFYVQLEYNLQPALALPALGWDSHISEGYFWAADCAAKLGVKKHNFLTINEN